MSTEMGDEIFFAGKRPSASRDGADKWLFSKVSAKVRDEITLTITLVVTSLERTRKA